MKESTKNLLIAAAVVAVAYIVITDPALAQSLDPITNKVSKAKDEAVKIGQAVGGLSAAGACIGWMFNAINPKWAGGIAAGGAGLAGISTIAGFVNS